MKRAIHLLVFIFFILVTSLPVRSQSLYEIKFTDKQKIQYSCFLVYFNETNAYVRVAYTYNNAYNVVNVTYQVRNGVNSQGEKYSLFAGSRPVFITENKANLSYNPDYFIWFYNNAAQKWDTPYTTDDSLLNPKNYVLVDSYVQLNPNNITDEYLRRYFGNYESQYVSLKKMCGITQTEITTNTNDNNKPARLHLVLIANTLDATIGSGCSSDKTNLTNEFRQVADALGVSFQEYLIDGSSFSKDRLLSTINSLSPGANDIVLFIYRGHGFRWKDQTDDWPRMDLRSNPMAQQITEATSMNLSEVYSILKSKKARLNIILGDCCNSAVNISSVTANNYLTFQVDNNSDITKLKKLFMNSNGIILSAAAQKGEVSWNSPQGGLYSISFLQALREEISYLHSGNASWDNIVSKTITLARTKSTPTYCSNCTLQNGIKYVSLAN